jgi:hypothetical protein
MKNIHYTLFEGLLLIEYYFRFSFLLLTDCIRPGQQWRSLMGALLVALCPNNVLKISSKRLEYLSNTKSFTEPGMGWNQNIILRSQEQKGVELTYC